MQNIRGGSGRGHAVKCRPHKPVVLALLGVLLVAGSGFSAAVRASDLTPDTPCKWSTTVNGLKARICLSRTAVTGGSTVVLGTLTLRNETRRAITVSRWFESMRYSIVDGNGQPVTAGINEGGSAGGSIFGYSSTPQVVPARGELSIAIPGGGGVMRNKAAVLMLGTWATLYTVEPTDHPPYLHAVLEIDEREVDGRAPPEPRDWSGRLEFRDVQIPLGVEKASSSKVTRTLAEARKALATNDRDQLRDAVYKLTLLDSLRVVPLYMQAFDIADSLSADYVQGVVVDGLGWLLKHHPDDELKEVIAGLQKISQPGAAIPQVRARAEEYLTVPVEGRVLDASGNPVANARVGIFRGVNPDNAPCPRSVKPEECLDYLFSMGADRAHAVTGEDGRYTLRVPGGLVNSDTLWMEGADARGERLRFFRTIDTCCGLRAQVGSIVLQQVADFTALIQHEGQPIAAAQVSFLPGYLYGDPQQTDITGSVTTHRNPEPTVDNVAMMVVRAEGFATEYRGSAIRPGTTTQTIDLTRETVLTGRIVGPGGKPLAQATLRAIFVPGACPPCFPLYGDPIAGTTRTDGAGMFTLHGLRAGQSYRLLIDADGASIASSQRLVTAGSGPVEIALNTAVPVTLNISGLRGVLFQGVQSAESIAANASLNKMVIERALSTQPELVEVARVSNGPRLTILMEWLDPHTGAWLPVLSPRKVTVRDATHANLRFDKVPVGTIRISTTGGLPIFVQTFDPVTIRAGRRVVIPVQVTAFRQLQVQVIDREDRRTSRVQVEIGGADGAFTSDGHEAADGTFIFETDPRLDLSIRVIEADQVISTTPVPRGTARTNPLVMEIRL